MLEEVTTMFLFKFISLCVAYLVLSMGLMYMAKRAYKMVPLLAVLMAACFISFAVTILYLV